jgi:hypothetical protein
MDGNRFKESETEKSVTGESGLVSWSSGITISWQLSLKAALVSLSVSPSTQITT